MPRTRAQSIRRTATMTGLSMAAVVSARALFRPRDAATDRRLLDWEKVRRHAHARSGESGRLHSDTKRAAEYDAMARELAPLMADVLGAAPVSFPAFQAVDRRGFIDSNLLIAQRLVEPLEELRARLPESRATALSRTVMSRYVGELFGFLSHRVLGQYDPVLQLSPPMAGNADPPSLFLVEPNVQMFVRSHHVPAPALRRWLILHELTHAWQFESHPWLRDYVGGLMRELMMDGLVKELTGPQGSQTSRQIAGRLPGSLRAQMRGVARVQAVMSVLEGYSNFVMHRVGAAHLEHFDTLEKSFHARQKQRSLLERLVIAVTGMRMKMRQYEIGEKFAETVTKRADLATLNRVWDGPVYMPSMAELREPERWLRRVG